MRKCPDCGRTFDDSRTYCYNCHKETVECDPSEEVFWLNVKISLADAILGTKIKLACALEKDCPTCKGKGKIGTSRSKKECPDCHGLGKESRIITVKIPKGSIDGTRIVLKGDAEDPEKTPVDCYLFPYIKRNPFYKLEGHDFTVKVPVTKEELVSGERILVPAADGYIEMKIRKGSKDGHTFRLKGRGVPHLEDDGCGDEYVQVVVVDADKETVKELRKNFKVIMQLAGDSLTWLG